MVMMASSLSEDTRMGQGFTNDIGSAIEAYAKSTNDENREKNINKLQKYIVGKGVEMALSVTPIPYRAIGDIGSVISPTQTQQPLLADINEVGTYLGTAKTMARVFKMSLMNKTGISEYANLYDKESYANKPAIDWVGREVGKIKNIWVTEGVKYDYRDDMLGKLGLTPPYLTRSKTVEVSVKEEKVKSIISKYKRSINTIEDRYMTDEEYYNATRGMANFYDKFMNKNIDKMIKVYKSGTTEERIGLQSEMEYVINKLPASITEHIAERKGNITERSVELYLNSKLNSNRERQTSKKEFAE
jgi:hypothetical protein